MAIMKSVHDKAKKRNSKLKKTSFGLGKKVVRIKVR